MKFHLHPVGKIVLYTIYPYYVEAVVARPAWGPTQKRVMILMTSGLTRQNYA